MKRVVIFAAITFIPLQVLAQVPATLGTRAGHELNVSVSSYTYIEPGTLRISIKATKFAGEYAGTLLLGQSHHWFVTGDARGSGGTATYRGWCLPWLIRPNSRSPNGYELGLGEASTCSEGGEADWFLDGRGLLGRDFIINDWALSPYTGAGLRHLSNGLTGAAGFRTDKYLYLPLGMTAHTSIAAHRVSLNLEYDRLLRGWQTTRNGKWGGGDLPATATMPPFTIKGITDIDFEQHNGWALRTSAKYYLMPRWSVEPYFVHWSVDASPVNYQTASFTVNNVTAQQQLGAFEPFNTTSEFGVKLGFHF